MKTQQKTDVATISRTHWVVSVTLVIVALFSIALFDAALFDVALFHVALFTVAFLILHYINGPLFDAAV